NRLAPVVRRRWAEEQLAVQAAQLAHGNEALDDFASLVAHELKGPFMLRYWVVRRPERSRQRLSSRSCWRPPGPRRGQRPPRHRPTVFATRFAISGRRRRTWSPTFPVR